MHRPRRSASATGDVYPGEAYTVEQPPPPPAAAFRPDSAYAGIQSPASASFPSADSAPPRRPVSDPHDLVAGLAGLRMSEDDRVGPLPRDGYGIMGRSRSTASGRSTTTTAAAGPAASVYSLDSGMGAYGGYPGIGGGGGDTPQQTRRTSAQSTRSNLGPVVPHDGPAYDAHVSRDHGFPHPPPPVPVVPDYNPYFAAANDYLGPAPGPSTTTTTTMASPAASSSHLLRTASSASSLVSLKRTNTTNIGSKNARRQGHAGAIDVNKPPYTKEFVDDYRARMKGDPDPEAQFAFAKYLIEAARIIGDDMTRQGDARGGKKYRDNLLAESLKHIKRLATSGPEPYAEAQFFLANMYGTGQLGLAVDYEKAYHLYMQASKQNHPAATYRTAVCNELGAGTRKESTRAVLFYRKAASLRDSAAMYKLSMILLHGLLDQPRNQRDGITWLRRAAQQADAENPHALHELAMLHENPNLLGPRGAQLIAKDLPLARELYTQAAQLGYPPAQFKLGTAYEYGTLACAVDPKRSIAWLSRAAEKADPEAELALSGWFLTGAEGVLKQDDGEAYLWAKKSAMKGLAKAEFAVGCECGGLGVSSLTTCADPFATDYTEVGIGVKQDIELAKRWYMRAAGTPFPLARPTNRC